MVVINLEAPCQIGENSAGGLFVAITLNVKERARRWKLKSTMGVCAHDVTTTFPKSSIAIPVAIYRTGGRWRLRSTRHTGKRRRRELINERRNGASIETSNRLPSSALYLYLLEN